MSRKIVLSSFSGLAILLVTWIYQNYNFTFSAEDAFISKVSFWKYKIFSANPQLKTNFVFINTGKDLALVDDSAAGYGNVAVSDRFKIWQFLHGVDSLSVRPLFTVVDIQFYYPYTIDPHIDTLMQAELTKNDRMVIAALPDSKQQGYYQEPIYKAKLAYADYQTFGPGINKFQIINHAPIPSIPVAMDEALNKSVYKDHGFFATCNGHLCVSGLWPSYYLNDNDVKANRASSYAQFYNIGEILTDMQVNKTNYRDFFADKIVIIGNFELDFHPTAIGLMAGSVIVANIYLSLLNGHHLVSYLFLFILLVVFSGLSYMAWFSKVPEPKIRFNFIFSPHLVKFIKSYISYFGSMFLLSVIALVFFNMQIALFLPSFIFSIIEYFRQKKYLPEK